MDPKPPSEPPATPNPGEPAPTPEPEALTPSPVATQTPEATLPSSPIETPSPFSQTYEPPPMQSPEPTPTHSPFEPVPIPSPEPTPTEPVFRGAKTGNDLGYLTQEPMQPAPQPAPETNPDQRAPDEQFIPAPSAQPETPTPEPVSANLTDINPNWRTPVPPEVHEAAQNAQAAGYKPSLEDTQPISLDAIRKVAAAQGIDIPTPEPTPTPEPPLPEGYHLGDTVVITPEMRTEIDRIKTEVASNQPTEPLPASTPLMTTVEQPTPAPNPAAILDAMGHPNFVPPASMEELSGGPNFFDRIKTQNTQPPAQSTVEQPTPQVQNRSWIDKLFGKNK